MLGAARAHVECDGEGHREEERDERSGPPRGREIVGLFAEIVSMLTRFACGLASRTASDHEAVGREGGEDPRIELTEREKAVARRVEPALPGRRVVSEVLARRAEQIPHALAEAGGVGERPVDEQQQRDGDCQTERELLRDGAPERARLDVETPPRHERERDAEQEERVGLVFRGHREGREYDHPAQGRRRAAHDCVHEPADRDEAPEEVGDVEVRRLRVVGQHRVEAARDSHPDPCPRGPSQEGADLRDVPQQPERQEHADRSSDRGHRRHRRDADERVDDGRRLESRRPEERRDPHGRRREREQEQVERRVRVVVARPVGLEHSHQEVPRGDAIVVPAVGRREAPREPGAAQEQRDREDLSERRSPERETAARPRAKTRRHPHQKSPMAKWKAPKSSYGRRVTLIP